MRTVILCCAVWAFCSPVRAQNEYIICEPQEFCICWNGSVDTLVYTFASCPDSAGALMRIVFCSADIPPGLDISIYDGIDNTAPVIYNLNGGSGSIAGLELFTTTPSLCLELEYTAPSAQNCASGEFAPWRFWVAVGYPDPAPSALNCTGSGTSCPTTQIANASEVPALWFYYSNGQLHATTPLPSGATLELLDLSGRSLEAHRSGAGNTILLNASLATGTYVLVLRSNNERIAQRVVVMD